jgi:4-hydroxybenzoate polyprenyltransferase
MMFFAALQNDIYDRVADNAGSRKAPLNQGQLRVGVVTAWCRIFLAAGIAAALATMHWVSAALLVAFAGLVWSYNAPPLRLSYRPIASILTLGLLLSALPLTAGVAVSEQPVSGSNLGILMLGLFLTRMSVSILKDYKDYQEDKRFNKQTFLITYGAAATKNVSFGLAGLGYVLTLFILPGMVAKPIAAALLVPLATYALWVRSRLTTSSAEMSNQTNFQSTFTLSIYFEMIVLACFLI